MGVTDPAGPVMDRDEVDRALARLGAEHEAIETSLLALQDHAGRRLLEGAALTGGRAGEDEETQGTRKSATARGDRWATRDPPGR